MTKEEKQEQINDFREEVLYIFEGMNDLLDDIDDSQFDIESYADDLKYLTNRPIASMLHDVRKYGEFPHNTYNAVEELERGIDDLNEYLYNLIDIGKRMKKFDMDLRKVVREMRNVEGKERNFNENLFTEDSMNLFNEFVVPALRETKKKKTAKQKKLLKINHIARVVKKK